MQCLVHIVKSELLKFFTAEEEESSRVNDFDVKAKLRHKADV